MLGVEVANSKISKTRDRTCTYRLEQPDGWLNLHSSHLDAGIILCGLKMLIWPLRTIS